MNSGDFDILPEELKIVLKNPEAWQDMMRTITEEIHKEIIVDLKKADQKPS